MKKYLYKATLRELKFLFGHVINILLTIHGRSLWENLDLGRQYRPHWVKSGLKTSVKILSLAK